jgi:NAD(P)-dependent dehydrogenase (short-subunit alcohol dehydrogenase family)
MKPADNSPAPRCIALTGGASGIGRAAAVLLASADYRIALLDIDAEGMRQTAKLCPNGAEVLAFSCDVTDEHGLADVSEQIATTLGPPDILINCAGIARYAPFASLAADEWRRQFDVNVMGSVLPIRAFLPGMLKRGRGLIINVGSRRGLDPTKGTAAYSASKAGLRALGQSLTEEYGARGISVSYLAPGGTMTALDTPKLDSFMEAETVGRAIRFMCDVFPAGWVRQLELLSFGGTGGASTSV